MRSCACQQCDMLKYIDHMLAKKLVPTPKNVVSELYTI